jgi:hypothetical protein
MPLARDTVYRHSKQIAQPRTAALISDLAQLSLEWMLLAERLGAEALWAAYALLNALSNTPLKLLV